MTQIQVHFTELREGAVLPRYAHLGDAGMDITACEDVLIHPGETKLVPTGFAIAIPEGYEAQVRPRSGLSLKTMLRIPNSPGTIDSGYRDEVCIIVHNASFPQKEESVHLLDTKSNPHGSYLIRKGDRVAQIVFALTQNARFEVVPSVKDLGENREGGFGSTGVSAI